MRKGNSREYVNRLRSKCEKVDRYRTTFRDIDSNALVFFFLNWMHFLNEFSDFCTVTLQHLNRIFEKVRHASYGISINDFFKLAILSTRNRRMYKSQTRR